MHVKNGFGSFQLNLQYNEIKSKEKNDIESDSVDLKE